MSIYGNKQFAAPRYLYPTPTDTPEERTCVTLSLPFNSAWIGLWIGALLVLCDEDSFVQFEGGITPEQAADTFRDALIDALTEALTECTSNVPTPYWDEASTADDESPAETQQWYGVVTDWLAPIDSLNFVENAAVWVLTGFVAYAAGAGAAIYFRTVARQFVLAVQVQDVGEIIRVVVDAADYHIDTDGKSVGDIVELAIEVTDPELDEHDIYIISQGVP